MEEVSIKRGTGASSLTELSVALVAMAFILILVTDCAKVFIASQINDNTCRKAARVAATGDPASAKPRAESIVLKARQESSGMLADLRLVSVVNTINGNSDGTTIQLNGGNVTGTVVVKTAADIDLFFRSFLPAGRRVLTVTSQQSFPYTYILPPALTNQ